MADMFKI